MLFHSGGEICVLMYINNSIDILCHTNLNLKVLDALTWTKSVFIWSLIVVSVIAPFILTFLFIHICNCFVSTVMEQVNIQKKPPFIHLEYSQEQSLISLIKPYRPGEVGKTNREGIIMVTFCCSVFLNVVNTQLINYYWLQKFIFIVWKPKSVIAVLLTAHKIDAELKFCLIKSVFVHPVKLS